MEISWIEICIGFLGIIAREVWEYVGEYMGWLKKAIIKRTYDGKGNKAS